MATKELSRKARELQEGLAANPQYVLVQPGVGGYPWWRVIPSLRQKRDGRMGWKPEGGDPAAQELCDCGLIVPHPEDDKVFVLSSI